MSKKTPRFSASARDLCTCKSCAKDNAELVKAGALVLTDDPMPSQETIDAWVAELYGGKEAP